MPAAAYNSRQEGPTMTRRDAFALAALPLLAAEPRRHSLVHWCFSGHGERWSPRQAAAAATELGIGSVELIDPPHWPTLAAFGLTCAIAGNGYPRTGFKFGLNNPRHSGDVAAATRSRIRECAGAKVPSVIAFVGYKWVNPDDPKSGEITRDDAKRECVARLKELATDAERAGVTVCVEHLNSRDATTPMTGHPGYQGDDLDFVCEILRAVGSPRVKLLFDIYHVQIMHGDLIRRVRQCGDLIGHVHTAGVPGRHELDDTQEIHYPAVMAALKAVGYRGYVGHEFIPTRDPRAGLRQAIERCST
jgi:hydroxypyruvate isomerase